MPGDKSDGAMHRRVNRHRPRRYAALVQRMNCDWQSNTFPGAMSELGNAAKSQSACSTDIPWMAITLNGPIPLEVTIYSGTLGRSLSAAPG